MITQQLRAFCRFVETYCAMRHLAPEQREDMPTFFRVTGDRHHAFAAGLAAFGCDHVTISSMDRTSVQFRARVQRVMIRVACPE